MAEPPQGERGLSKGQAQPVYMDAMGQWGSAEYEERSEDAVSHFQPDRGKKRMNLTSPSLIDLALPGIIDDCRCELLRCERREADFGEWAQKWGRSIIDELKNPNVEPDTDEIGSLADKLSMADGAISELRGAIERALDELEEVIEDIDVDAAKISRDDMAEAINKAASILENIL